MHNLVPLSCLLGAACLLCCARVVFGYDCDFAETCSLGSSAKRIRNADAVSDLRPIHVAALARYQPPYGCDEHSVAITAQRDRFEISPSTGMHMTSCDSIPTHVVDLVVVYTQLATVVLISLWGVLC